MLQTFGSVFKNPAYTLLAALVALGVFLAAVWLPNSQLIFFVLTDNTATLFEKISFLGSLVGSIGTNFTPLSASTTIGIALLFGINVALLWYYIKKVRVGNLQIRSLGGMSAIGVISGFFGIGCAACGTFILSSALVLVGAGGILAYLPFGGEGFSFIGVALLFYATTRLLQKIAAPNTC